jgi:hypothetical protein
MTWHVPVAKEVNPKTWDSKGHIGEARTISLPLGVTGTAAPKVWRGEGDRIQVPIPRGMSKLVRFQGH